MTTSKLLAARAGVAERAVGSRHLRRVWGVPGTALGAVNWPVDLAARTHVRFNYWWQAHLLDCALDAHLRAPTKGREALVRKLVRGIRVRNVLGWTNRYYDDVAWLGLALQRAARQGVAKPRALDVIAAHLRAGWTDHAGGGIWWRTNDDFKNVPANGPAAIFLARRAEVTGDRADLGRAESTVDWIEANLLDGDTGLLFDGLHVHPDGRVREVERTLFTYCQGVVLGACVEIARVEEDPVWSDRAARIVDAVDKHLATDGVLRGHGGGDGGLFGGILARYLAQAALHLPGDASALAADLVFRSAEALWTNRSIVVSGPLFGPEWTDPAQRPTRASAERDLSVQLGGWMLLEAAALLERNDFTPPR
ncbi:glycoside hydrolase family 76 protein [Actinosynnema sp. NPDC020468]|uniref:glycoside hydrolase family 76 protein n=1 Tax=Actinosynnema sp. NPDC020468 TaxID=3154488 RepID=UPI0033FE0DB0